MKTEGRSEKHKRNEEVEACLRELSTLLSPAGRSRQKEMAAPMHPTIFVMGCARSGTTLLNQFLVKQLDCCYPSNFISRFFYAPYIGALLQKLMYDLDHNAELLAFCKEIPLSSTLGKTKGPLSPHEFWYFWRQYFFFGELQKLDETKADPEMALEFAQGLYSIQSVFNKPLVLKGMIMNWNIPYLANIMKRPFFVFVEREMEYNAQSLLLARKDFYDDVTKWYSFKPEEYPVLVDKSPEEQVVAQVHYTNEAIRQGLKQLSPELHITIPYNEFCSDPGAWIEKLSAKLRIDRKEAALIPPINEEKKIKVEPESWERICAFSEQYKRMSV